MTEELLARQENRIRRQLQLANFPFAATIEQFDFTLHPELKRAVILRYFDTSLITETKSLLLIGPSGTGKPHLAIAVGTKTVQLGYQVRFVTAQRLANLILGAMTPSAKAQLRHSGLSCDVLILDEFGYLPLDPQIGPVLYEIIAGRYGKGAMIFTSNKSLPTWGEVIGDNTLMMALLDRLLHHAISLLQYNLGRKAQAYQVYRDLLTEAQRQGNRSLECQANFMLGSMMVDDNVDLSSAQQLLETAGHIAEEIGDLITQINAYNDLTYVAIAQEDLTKANEVVGYAIQLVRRQAQRGKIAQTLFVQSDVAVQSGQWQAACAAIEESIVLFTADDAVWQPQAYA